MSKYLPSDHTFAVCAYGAAPFLEQCVVSLLDQTIRTNILVATSTPNEHICATAEKYDIPLYVNEGEPGIAHDWNCAVSYCKTPLVTIAHQDDTYLPSFAEMTLDYLNGVASPLIAFTDYGEIRNGQVVDQSKLLRVKRTLLFPLKSKCGRSSCFIRRRVLSVGSPICCPSVTYVKDNLPDRLFTSTMKSNLDWEAWEQYSKLKGEFVYIPKLLMRHRIHEGSETTALIKDDTRTKEDFIMLKKFWPSFLAPIILKLYQTSQDSNDI